MAMVRPVAFKKARREIDVFIHFFPPFSCDLNSRFDAPFDAYMGAAPADHIIHSVDDLLRAGLGLSERRAATCMIMPGWQ